MFEHFDLTKGNFVTYELSADDFELYQGDTVAPGCDIGIDTRSGSIVYLDCWGEIASVYYNPMNHSYSVMVFQVKQPRFVTNDANNENFVTV